jgi:acyl carrier protein
MKNTIDDVVKSALAFHAGVDVSRIRPTQLLDEDLGLDTLEVVLVGMDVEEGAPVDIPFEELASIHTVAELLLLVHRLAEPERLRRRVG